MFLQPYSWGAGEEPTPAKTDSLKTVQSREQERQATLATPHETGGLWRQAQGKALEAGRGQALTVDEAVFLGQEGSLQTFPTAHGPTEQHPWGERGVGSMVGLDIGQSWKTACMVNKRRS